MTDPISIAAQGGIAGTAASGLLNAFGSVMSGNATDKMYQYQSSVALMNKQISLQNADYSRHVGEVEAQTSGMKTRATVGVTKAAQAGSGFDVNTGTGAQVRESEQELGIHDQSTIRANAARRAYGYDVEAAQEGAQSEIYKASGKNARTAGYIKAAGSILGAAGSVSDKWLQASSVGVGSGGGSKGSYDPMSGYYS